GCARAEVVRLLEHDLAGGPVLVVLVRRVARPVSGGREHLDHEQPLGRELRLDDVVDLARRVAGAAHLDLDVLRLDERRLAPALTPGTAERHLALGLDAVVRAPRQVESPRHPGEDARAPAELPRSALGLDPGASRERHERDLAVASRGLERPAADAEEEIPPAGRLRGHLLP